MVSYITHPVFWDHANLRCRTNPSWWTSLTTKPTDIKLKVNFVVNTVCYTCMMSEDRKGNGAKRFAILSKESVKLFAEAAGHSGLSDEVAALLAEDVSYRLREATQNSSQFLRHARRKKLTSEDFNKALKNADAQPVFGYGSTDAMPFRRTKEGELSFVEDGDVNLANIAHGTHVPHQTGKATFKAHWLAVEGMARNQALGGKLNKPQRNLTDQQRQYLDNITKAILGTETELTKLALNDLRTNHNTSPLLPYLLNFISNGVKSSSHDIPQLKKFLQTVRALINNQSLFLQPKPYPDLLIESVIVCVIDPLSASIIQQDDHWALREFAARLLVQILRLLENSALEQEILDRLQEVLYDLDHPLCSHYGAVIALGTFGTQAVEEILRPHLPSYIPHLEALMEDSNNPWQQANATKVHAAIRLCCEYVMRARSDALLKSAALSADTLDDDNPVEPPPDTSHPQQSNPHSTISKPVVKSEPGGSKFTDKDRTKHTTDDLIGTVLQLPDSTDPYKIAAELYAEFSAYFGDSLSAKLPVAPRVNGLYSSLRKGDSLVELYSEESKKTGEELLQELMNAPAAAPLPPPHHHHSRGPSRMHSMANTDDTDFPGFFDDENSEMSSRSGRSNSDNLSFLLDDADLTVKSTVNDPSLGVKLTITKRPKTKSESLAESASKRQKLHPNRLNDCFPGRRHICMDKTIMFRIRGTESTRKKGGSLPSSSKVAGQAETSKYFKLSINLPTLAKSTAVTLSAKSKMHRVHKFAASLDTVL